MEDKNRLIQEINRLKEERNAIILAHNYQRPEVQDIADYVGDSLGLSQQAALTDADVIIFCGVHFMAETAYILAPEKTVILPDLNSGCPLADMVTVEALRKRKQELPGHMVVTYINSSAAVKAESDVICTSSNAIDIIEGLDTDKILYIPDKNLALWAQQHSDKDIAIWPGFCPTHHYIKPSHVNDLKKTHPDAEFIAHPECVSEVLELADFVGSTSAMYKYARQSDASFIIVGSEMGMLHRLQKDSPDKEFVLANKQVVCPNMKRTTLPKIKEALTNLKPRIVVEESIRIKALVAVQRMLEASKPLAVPACLSADTAGRQVARST